MNQAAQEIKYFILPFDIFVDINECGSSPCKNGGQCNNLVNGFNCTCVAGFNGTLCQNSKYMNT